MRLVFLTYLKEFSITLIIYKYKFLILESLLIPKSIFLNEFSLQLNLLRFIFMLL